MRRLVGKYCPEHGNHPPDINRAGLCCDAMVDALPSDGLAEALRGDPEVEDARERIWQRLQPAVEEHLKRRRALQPQEKLN